MVSGGLIRRFSRPKSFRCGLPAPVRATAVISLLGFLAFLLLVTALPSAPAYAGTPIQGPAQTGYLQDMRDAALDEVNVRRDVAQVAPVEVHPALEEAAQQHALYLLLNSDEWAEGSLHTWRTPDSPVSTRHAWVSGLTSRAIPTLCLLYTSDAADDLLCVDLGG